ncbi:MAG: exodeoxyribonuclease VII small subunit [Aphanocapsa sp. GSE-SYN-MK-11-07L]|jgi:exodeoxyribonuclease VII small subunit|nr:exodeoxyribonuclease VII small subunit [Aphanocapsa sp. GSE-SYN-MK-11-07L]
MNKSARQFPPNSEFQPGWSYELAVTEIETMIAEIESGQLDLADVFDQFTTAAQMLQQCEQFLKQRRQQMELLIEQLDAAEG